MVIRGNGIKKKLVSRPLKKKRKIRFVINRSNLFLQSCGAQPLTPCLDLSKLIIGTMKSFVVRE
jgi:hypothetical protein